MKSNQTPIGIKILIILTIVAGGLVAFQIYSYKTTPCPDYSIGAKAPGIYSVELGKVKILNEECKIIETYQVFPCNEPEESDICKGKITFCPFNKTLTRLTVCPEFQSENQINWVRNNKSWHEEIK